MAKFSKRAPKGSKSLHHCDDGPWAGAAIALTSTCDGCTAWLQIGSAVGRYRHGTWQPMKS